jgi:hypothetical protein
MRKVAFIAANVPPPRSRAPRRLLTAPPRLAQQGVEVRASVIDWGVPVKQVERLRAAGFVVRDYRFAGVSEDTFNFGRGSRGNI